MDERAASARERKSKSADAARELELQRIAALSARERMILALELGEMSRLLLGRGPSEAAPVSEP